LVQFDSIADLIDDLRKALEANSVVWLSGTYEVPSWPGGTVTSAVVGANVQVTFDGPEGSETLSCPKPADLAAWRAELSTAKAHTTVTQRGTGSRANYTYTNSPVGVSGNQAFLCVVAAVALADASGVGVDTSWADGSSGTDVPGNRRWYLTWYALALFTLAEGYLAEDGDPIVAWELGVYHAEQYGSPQDFIEVWSRSAERTGIFEHGYLIDVPLLEQIDAIHDAAEALAAAAPPGGEVRDGRGRVIASVDGGTSVALAARQPSLDNALVRLSEALSNRFGVGLTVNTKGRWSGGNALRGLL